jgi:glutaminase
LKYNALVLNPEGKPHNPFINAGGIMICSLLGKGLDQSQRFSETLQNWQKLSAGRPITFDNTVFLSERNTNDNNLALAYLM